MQEELQKKFPAWTNQIDNNNMSLMLSNDLDSLFSGCILKLIFNVEISNFYDFKSVHASTVHERKENLVSVDIAQERGMTFDNHVCKISEEDRFNELSANLNLIHNIHKGNYFMKYAGSTLLQVLSLYRFLDGYILSELQKAFLLSVDCTYKGYYSKHSNDRQAFTKYIELLELESLTTCLNGHSESDFKKVIEHYRLYEHIRVNENGKLETKIELYKIRKLFSMVDLSLPAEKFELVHTFPSPKGYNVDNVQTKPKGLFSFALTNEIFAMLHFGNCL